MSDKPNMPEEEFKEILYIALMMLSSSSKDPRIIPELMYLLDADTFIRLVNVYSGKSIKIPSKDKLLKAIKTVTYYYHVEIKGADPETVRRTYDITKYTERHIKRRVDFFKKKIRERKFSIPKHFRSSELMKGVHEEIWKTETVVEKPKKSKKVRSRSKAKKRKKRKTR
jgi:hypothetical protein